MSTKSGPAASSLTASSYFSPYSRSGAPEHRDAYGDLRSKALTTLEAMGFEPQTMVERGVTWAEDQDPFGHVMQSQYMHFFGLCWQRVMESYEEYLGTEAYRDLLRGKTVIPVINKYEIHLKRQVKYPDSVSLARRSC